MAQSTAYWTKVILALAVLAWPLVGPALAADEPLYNFEVEVTMGSGTSITESTGFEPSSRPAASGGQAGASAGSAASSAASGQAASEAGAGVTAGSAAASGVAPAQLLAVPKGLISWRESVLRDYREPAVIRDIFRPIPELVAAPAPPRGQFLVEVYLPEDGGAPSAAIMDEAGDRRILVVGSSLGDGRISAIERDRILIEESVRDFRGYEKRRQSVLPLTPVGGDGEADPPIPVE